jgi:hypothetical protein
MLAAVAAEPQLAVLQLAAVAQVQLLKIMVLLEQ